MSLSQKLVQLGFTKNQSAVYASLVELGQTKAGAIIKQTGLHRNIVYEALDELVHRRLAFKTSKGGVAFFQLSDAATLVTDAQKELALAKEISREINRHREKSRHEVKLYEGEAGLRAHRTAVYADLGKTSQELLVMGASLPDDNDAVLQVSEQQRIELDIPSRQLFAWENRAQADARDKLALTDARLLPQSVQEPVAVEIWGDQVALLLDENDPFIVSVKNRQLARSFQNYFEALWQQDLFTTTGLAEVKELFYRKMYALKAGEEYAVLGANWGEETRGNLVEWFKRYHADRLQRGVKVKLLGFVEDEATLRNEIVAAGDTDFDLTELRYLTQDFASPMQINIYPDSVVLIYWSENAVAVEIQREEIRQAMGTYFQGLWQIGTSGDKARKRPVARD